MISFHHLVVLLVFLTLEPQRTLQQNAGINISPQRAKTGEIVNFVCSNTLSERSAVYFSLMRGPPESSTEVARMDVTCSSSRALKQVVSPILAGGSVSATGCSSMTVANVVASHGMAGQYRCDIQSINSDFSQSLDKSQSLDMTVGDPTPPISRFQLSNKATGETRSSDGEMQGGVSISIECETAASNPAPDFTVKMDGNLLETVKTATGVEAFVLVPKKPKVVFTCEANNGFGNAQSARIFVTVQYEASHNQLVFPKEVTFDASKEIEICSVANNPPKPLVVAGLESLLQAGYPRGEEQNGHSRVFVKLKENAGSAKALDFTCGLQGTADPVKASVPLVGVDSVTPPGTRPITSTTASYNISNALNTQLSTPSSAMMTIGIVIAVVVVFIILVAVIAVAVKKRSAANKASNGDNAQYGKVNQNDTRAIINGVREVSQQSVNSQRHPVWEAQIYMASRNTARRKSNGSVPFSALHLCASS